MMTELIKALGVCLVTAAFSVVLRQKSAEFSFVLVIISGVIVLGIVLKAVAAPIEEISGKLESYGVKTEYFKVALKAMGLAYITDFVAEACRDSGQASLASRAELLGKTAIFILSLPLVMSVLETALGFIK